MKPRIIVCGILDTKGAEICHLAKEVALAGGEPSVLELSLGTETGLADIPISEVLWEDGLSIEQVAAMNRADAAAAVGKAATKFALRLHAEGKAQGIVAFGGSMGSSIASEIMRALPLGFPKMLVSTLSGNIRTIVGNRDITLMYAISEAGINSVTRRVLRNAAYAVVGMANSPALSEGETKPLVGCMMMGLTTPGVREAAAFMARRGYDIMINHATGAGGESMEELIAGGHIAGMLDLSINELSADVVGGKSNAGPMRLRTAARMGVPIVIAPGAVDFLIFGERAATPEPFRSEIARGERGAYDHNPSILCIGTKPAEVAAVARELARRIASAGEKAAVCVPMRGFSALDRKDAGPLWLESDAAPGKAKRAEVFFAALCDELVKCGGKKVRVVPADMHINDPGFGNMCGEMLEEMLR